MHHDLHVKAGEYCTWARAQVQALMLHQEGEENQGGALKRVEKIMQNTEVDGWLFYFSKRKRFALIFVIDVSLSDGISYIQWDRSAPLP